MLLIDLFLAERVVLSSMRTLACLTLPAAHTEAGDGTREPSLFPGFPHAPSSLHGLFQLSPAALQGESPGCEPSPCLCSRAPGGPRVGPQSPPRQAEVMYCCEAEPSALRSSIWGAWPFLDSPRYQEPGFSSVIERALAPACPLPSSLLQLGITIALCGEPHFCLSGAAAEAREMC